VKLGFVSAIFPEWTLDEVLGFAATVGYSSVEVMCWPPGKAERRYAGVTHLDATKLGRGPVRDTLDLTERHGVAISSLGYYPNPLASDPDESGRAVAHLATLIDAAAELGVGTVTSFVGRDPKLTVEANWPRFLDVWGPLVEKAEGQGVRIGIENCPMLFTQDEWPGGKNLATSPSIWRRMFEAIPSPSFGLNYDPSHLVFQRIDHLAPLAEFRDRLVHVHAKDVRVDRKGLDEHGILGYPNLWHTPKLPGLGEIRWGEFLGTLAEAGYDGHVAVEVEDRAFEGSLARRQEALVLSRRHLIQHLAG